MVYLPAHITQVSFLNLNEWISFLILTCVIIPTAGDDSDIAGDLEEDSSSSSNWSDTELPSYDDAIKAKQMLAYRKSYFFLKKKTTKIYWSSLK